MDSLLAIKAQMDSLPNLSLVSAGRNGYVKKIYKVTCREESSLAMIHALLDRICQHTAAEAMALVEIQIFKLINRLKQGLSNRVNVISLIVQPYTIYAVSNKPLCCKDPLWIMLKELLECIVEMSKCKEVYINMNHTKHSVTVAVSVLQKCTPKDEFQKEKVTVGSIEILYYRSDISEKTFINLFIEGKFHHRSVIQAEHAVLVKKLCFNRSLYQDVDWLEMCDNSQIVDLKWILLSFHVSCLQIVKKPKPKQQNQSSGMDSSRPVQYVCLPGKVVINTITILDIGEQSEYIHLLPTINMHPVLNFMVHDLSKSLKDQILIKCSEDLKQMYHLKYSYMDMIKFLMPNVYTSIENMSSQLDIISDKGNGLHFSCVETRVDKFIDFFQIIAIRSASIVERFDCKTVMWENEETYITTGDDIKEYLTVCYIRGKINELGVYELLIICKLFRSELQQVCTTTGEACISWCSLAHQAIYMEDDLISLLHHPVLPDPFNHVIIDHQWIESLRCLTFKHFYSILDLEYSGTELILRFQCKEVLKEYFIGMKIKGLRKRKHNTGDDFFIPCILPSQSLCDYILCQCSCFQDEQFLIQFTFNLLPKGSFYCLVVQLLQQLLKSWGYIIFSLTAFPLQATYYLSLNDKLSYLKLQIKHDYYQYLISINVKILELLVNALCEQLAFNRGKLWYSLHCQCRECDHSDDDHIAVPETLIPALNYVICSYGVIVATIFGNEHTVWLTKEASIVEHDTINLEHCHSFSGKVSLQWHNLWVQLLQEKPTDIDRYCVEMSKYWLDIDSEASWDKLINALEQIGQISLAVKIRNVFFLVISQQTAPVTTEKNATPNRAALCFNHYDSFYCPECKKTVCMCTVKDHFIGEVEHDGTYKSQINIAGRVADVLAPYAILNFLMLQLLLSNNHLASLSFVNVLQPSNCLYVDLHWSSFDKKVIEKPITKVNSSVIVDIVMETCFSKTFHIFDSINCNINNTSLPSMVESSAFSMQLNGDYPRHTNWATIFIALTLFFMILLSTVCNNFESVNVRVSKPSKLLNDAKLEECETSCKLDKSKNFVSDSLSEIECIWCDLNEIKNLQTSQKIFCKFVIKNVINQLAESIGGFYLLHNDFFDYKNLDFSLYNNSKFFLQETLVNCKKIELEIRTENDICKQESGTSNFSVLTFNSNSNKCLLSIPVAIGYQRLIAFSCDVFRPIDKDGDKPALAPSNQQPFVNPMGHEVLVSQGSSHNVGASVKPSNVQQSKVITKDRDDPVVIRPEGSALNANIHSSHTERDIVERDGHLPLHIEKNQKTPLTLEEKDGKLSLASGGDQTTPLPSVPTAHTNPATINVSAKPSHLVDHNFIGAQLVKGLPTEMESMPTVGPQLSALYNTNFDYNVQSSREEIKQKGNTRTTFYQHEVEQHAYNPLKTAKINSSVDSAGNGKVQVKPPEVKVETSKATNEFKPKPLPKKSCIVCGNKQYPLVNNLISLPHMDHYFVKERTEIRPSYYLAKLVLCHQYQNRNDVNEKTPDMTAAQRSQAAVLAADSAIEKDGAVTERKHFPMNLNRTGFVVFSSDLTRFTGSIKYPLPSRKATAVKLGKGGNGFVFAIFHNGKEYAVKKTVYRPNEIRVHSQLAHQNLVNLDAVLIGEEHEKHRGKFYAFCFMTKCDMDFRSVISTKDHGCLKHLKLQLSNQREIWQLVMVNIKYVLRSVLKALDYMHGQGLVHRDVKASNVLLKMQCKCSQPLMCACPQKYVVKLGDFDSSTTVPGYGLKIEPHQMIRYASVLPLGTMGYRAPEVSLHLVIAGPYEVLYTTAVDIWSFGCLLLNILIGKCGPLRQRGEASLLLSTQEQPYAESLYNQIIKIKELQKYYGDMPEMVDLVRKCLQVKVHCRPSAKQLLQLDILQCI